MSSKDEKKMRRGTGRQAGRLLDDEIKTVPGIDRRSFVVRAIGAGALAASGVAMSGCDDFKGDGRCDSDTYDSCDGDYSREDSD